jgi:hypothetical protein
MRLFDVADATLVSSAGLLNILRDCIPIFLKYPSEAPAMSAPHVFVFPASPRLASPRLVSSRLGLRLRLDAPPAPVVDHGASGAPVVDCKGQVVAVVSNLMTRTMQILSREIRISTAWNNPNVVSVPIQLLQDFATPE